VKERKHPQSGLALALALSLALQALGPAVAAAADGPAPSILDAPLNRKRDLRFRDITKKTFKDYFPEAAASSKPAFDALSAESGRRSHFEDDLRFVIARGGQKNAWDAEKFQAWWDAKKDSVLTPAQIKAWENMPIETLVGAAYVKFAADESENNQTKFRNMLEHYVDNEWVLWGLDGTVGAVGAVAAFVGSSLYTAFTVAIMGDFLRAYTDSITNTPKQVIGVMGTQHTGWLAAPLSEKGQAYVNYRHRRAEEKRRRKEEKKAEWARKNGLPTTEQLMSADERAKTLNADLAEGAQRHLALVDTEKKLAALPAELDRLLDPRFLPELSVEQMDRNLSKFNKQWSQLVVTWNSTTLPTAQTGRSVMADGVIFRMKDFARDAAIYENKMELYRQGIEANKRSVAAIKDAERARLEQNTLERMHLAGVSDGTAAERREEMAKAVADKEAGLKRIAEEEKLLAAKADEYLKLVDELASLEFDGKPADWAAAKALEHDLAKLGMPPVTMAELKDSQRALMVSRRQLVGSLASQMLHDMMYAELNRKMPDSLQRVLTAMRNEFGFHHFERLFRDEIHKVLHEAGIEIGRDVAASGQFLAELAVDATKAAEQAEELKAALGKAQPKGALARMRNVTDRMYIVRGTKYVFQGCATGFSAIGRIGAKK
jgi:hypothetical protein